MIVPERRTKEIGNTPRTLAATLICVNLIMFNTIGENLYKKREKKELLNFLTR